MTRGFLGLPRISFAMLIAKSEVSSFEARLGHPGKEGRHSIIVLSYFAEDRPNTLLYKGKFTNLGTYVLFCYPMNFSPVSWTGASGSMQPPKQHLHTVSLPRHILPFRLFLLTKTVYSLGSTPPSAALPTAE